MKVVLRSMGLFIAFLIIALMGLMVFVRLAPVDAAQWHRAQDAMAFDTRPADLVQATTGGAVLRLTAARGDPRVMLARLDDLALATPRTRRLAGSVEEGRITWETRSALWGFPDYTTAEVTADALHVHARLRFGREDMGVNAARLQGWLDGL